MASVRRPISGGMTAAPTIPVIINPEISFAFSGTDLRAAEIMIENMLEQRNPISPTQHNMDNALGAKNSATITAAAPKMLILKYLISSI